MWVEETLNATENLPIVYVANLENTTAVCLDVLPGVGL
jgi:hypothetical protein